MSRRGTPLDLGESEARIAARNEAHARILIEELARRGVREICIAPGSRSAPLVLAAYRHPTVRTYVHLDERSAAFFALGIGKATGRPAAVVTTSGTAVANLLPATIEAGLSGTPLLLLTADRPPRLRGFDANQTIDQVKLLGGYPRLFHEVIPTGAGDRPVRYLRALAVRAVAAALGPPAGPVHLNVPFEKPLEPAGTESGAGDAPAFERGGAPAAESPAAEPPAADSVRFAGRPGPPPEDLDALLNLISVARRVLLVGGPDPEPWRTGPALRSLSAAAGWPLLADPLSGGRFGAAAERLGIAAYDLILRDRALRARLAPDLILRTGALPTSPGLAKLLESFAGPHLHVDAGVRWPDPASGVTHFVRADPAVLLQKIGERLGEKAPAGTDGRYRELWSAADRVARSVLFAEFKEELFEGSAVAAVAESLPEAGTLFIGNSMPVRDLESFGLPRETELRILGNRGASGIDGTVSTALGAAAVSRGPTVAVIGDLALVHDMNGLLAAARFGIDITLVVLNNDGGGIFRFLPIREFEPPFTSHFVAPHGLDFRQAATLYDFRWLGAANHEELRRNLAGCISAGGRHLLEVRSDGEQNRRRRLEVEAAVCRAVTDALARREPGRNGA